MDIKIELQKLGLLNKEKFLKEFENGYPLGIQILSDGISDPKFVIGYDCLDKNLNCYILYKIESSRISVVLQNKRIDHDEFMEEVHNIAKYFNATILETKSK